MSSSHHGSHSSSSSSSSSSINALLKKTEHYDKDERYMATSDLCELLKRPTSSSGDSNSNSNSHSHSHSHSNSNNNTSSNKNTSNSNSNSNNTNKNFDSSTERRICTAVLRLLHDKSNDVQAVAVKTLGVLLQTVPQELVLEIGDSLTDQVLDAGKSELRDVYSIGLRTLVKTIPSNMGDSTSNRLITRLLDGIRNSTTSSAITSGRKNKPIKIDDDDDDINNEDQDPAATAKETAEAKEKEEIVLSCLDVLTDLLGRFGATSIAVTRQHEPVLQICLQLISNKGDEQTSPVVRKRAGNALGCLSIVLSDALLVSAVERLLSQIEDNNNTTIITNNSNSNAGNANSTSTTGGGGSNMENTRALIRTMCTISGAVGHRLQQPQIDRIIPIFLTFTNPEKASTGDDEDDCDDDDDAGVGGDGGDDNDDVMNAGDDSSQDVDEAVVQMANELRESCFMGFESFIQKCPTQVEPHLDKIVQAALAYMSYDPNYSYGIEDEEKKAADGDGNGMDEDDGSDYGYDDDDDGDGGYEDDGDDDFYDDDDDDESWKVRRSAIRSLLAVVETKKHNPGFLWSKSYLVRRKKTVDCVASALVGRFKEREENCRVGILETFTKLLQVTTTEITSNHNTSNLKFSVNGNVDNDETKMDDDAADETSDETSDVVTTIVDLHGKYAPAIVKGCEKLMGIKKGNERSKSYALSLLSTLCMAPGGVGGKDEILSVFTHVQTFLGDGNGDDKDEDANNGGNHHKVETTSKALRLDALSLIVAMLESNNHNPNHIREGLSSALLPQLCNATKEHWYKVIAEALRALAAVPKFFSGTTDTGTKQETTDIAIRLYDSIEPLLAAHDVDQEIKECALLATSSLLSELHTNLPKKHISRLSTLLLERLTNETTRIPAIKTFSSICSSKNGHEIDFATGTGTGKNNKGILGDSITTMSGFLKMQSRSLRQTSLEALDVVITNHGSTINPKKVATELYSSLLEELADLVIDTDLHISHLSLRASISALKVCPDSGPSVKDHLLPRALVLSTSPLLQDLALESLLAILEQIVISNAVDFQEVLDMLHGRLSKASESGSGKHAIYNLAQCIAVITSATTSKNQQGVVTDFLKVLNKSSTPTDEEELRKVQLSLLVSGDLGRMVDLGSISDNDDIPKKLNAIYMGYFDSPSEDLKNASAYALGRAAVGDTQSVFLPAIVNSLEENDTNEKKQYLLLSALRGFIQSSFAQSGGDGIASTLPLILPHLINHASDEKEGIRSMVAECLGSLTCMQPAIMCDKLCKMAEDHSAITVTDKGTVDADDTVSKKNAFVCWTVAISLKHAIAGKADPTQLSPYVPKILKLLLLDQKELGARNAALLMVYSAVHHMPQLVSGSNIMKDQITPALYEVATFKLQRKIDLGPFSHTVDDALPLRKAALSIFATSLENLPGSLDIGAFMPVLAATLKDVEDIQLQAHQIVITMCVRQPTYMVAAVETFVEPLEKTMNRKVGTKTGTELERLIDWKKSALRTMVALSKVDGTMNSRKFAEFVERIKGNSKFRSALDAIEEER